jgi:hypothetical protein
MLTLKNKAGPYDASKFRCQSAECTAFPLQINWLMQQKKIIGSQARSQNCEKRLLALSCLCVRYKLAPTGRIPIKFDILVFFKNLSRKSKIH